ncbi:PREDICTED: msx2-interacting protein-like [Thamnophis sirtalis]|uniref:Msx2-interacting protein-like n=1 Tax=Thamnophis sirtalis TaxID=35019 RepID=A0A6I9Y741_9SAUR|nr:PREDICTED: msx2-interacting protein-like [Thamnophis sirtalis]
MVRENKHLWVGNLPENVREEKIIKHFKRASDNRERAYEPSAYGHHERGTGGFDRTRHYDQDYYRDPRERTLQHGLYYSSRSRSPSRFDAHDPHYKPRAREQFTLPSVVHRDIYRDDLTREVRGRRSERSYQHSRSRSPHSFQSRTQSPQRLASQASRSSRSPSGSGSRSQSSSSNSVRNSNDRASDNRERAYEPSAYGHHERGTGGFDRTRHYDQDYYRDPRERTLQHGLYYSSRSRSLSRFDVHGHHYEPRAREQFTLPSVVHRDIYRDDLTREVRGRRPERSYQHSRSRSPHSSQSRTQSPQRLASQASRSTRSPSGSGSRSRSSSSDPIRSSSNTSRDSSDSSDESSARSVQSTAVPAPTSQLLPPLEKDEPRKSFGIKVQNLPVRSTDTSLKDGLFHKFKKYGKVTCVQIHGASEERYGLVFFRQQEDQEKALNASKGKLFFGIGPQDGVPVVTIKQSKMKL